MASGNGKSPPEPPCEPETESGIGLFQIGIVVALLCGSFAVFFAL
jgi:hypothetical protein